MKIFLIYKAIKFSVSDQSFEDGDYALIQYVGLWYHPFLNEIYVNKIARSSGSPTGEWNNIWKEILDDGKI